MKVTLSWLKEYVDFTWSHEELRERLTMLGLEVEGMERIGGEFEGVVVAQIVSSDKHPNADKLSVCRVTDGQQERQIVCGAKNFQAGDKVPLALPGATLPTPSGEPPFTIKTGKIRGVESHGMMCSPKELGLAEDAQGLMILPPEAQVGQTFAAHLGRPAGDVVYDLEITPNRPDLNSVIGIAREISALTGNPLRTPELGSPGTAAAEIVTAEQCVCVHLADPDLCPRYVARIIRGVTVGASPDWLRSRLEQIGIRSINNVVDVTNFVMMETGQPLHAFDYHLLARNSQSGCPTIIVRRAADGEKFVTLDGQQRTLSAQMLLIADETKAVALAGVMGGHNSEINLNTANVLLESAYFKPQNIRATSKKLELRTDASYRFERGADIEICDWASWRAAQLIVQAGGGQIVPGAVDAYPTPFRPRQITLRHAKVNELLGIDLAPAQNIEFLRRVGLDVFDPSDESCTVKAPSFRVDLKREVDLIEEIVRLYGVDKIPSTPPRGAIGLHACDAAHDQLAETRRILVGLGLNEAQGQTLISHPSAELARSASSNEAASELAALARPLSSDMNVLRPSLLPGLLDALRHNLNHKRNDVALFEIGRVFARNSGEFREERRLALAMTGQRRPAFWCGPDREAKVDIFDLKGVVEELLDHLGIRGVTYQRRSSPTGLYVESADVQLGKFRLGEIGQVLPALAKRYDLRDPAFVAEFNLDLVLARRSTARAFKALPAFPSIRRDVAMIVPEATTHEAVLNAVKQAKAQNLEEVQLFDVFRGKNVPAGQKSVAYAFTYRNLERTLTDAEVNAAHEKLVNELKRTLHATVRE